VLPRSDHDDGLVLVADRENSGLYRR